MAMLTLEKISTLEDMRLLMNDLRRLEAKFLCDFYGALQDFSSKRFLPQWLQKNGVKNVFVSEKGNDILLKINASKRLSVVVYDIETPDLNGLQLLAALEKNPDMKSRCRVIFVVPKLALDVQAKLLNSGACALVPRPINDEYLQAAFAKIGFEY